MPVNPYIKGGTDVSVLDGGTGASTAGGARTNLMALDEVAHDLLDHSGLTGVGDLTVAAHSSIDHGPFTHSLLNVGTVSNAVASGDLATGTSGGNRLFYDESANWLSLDGVTALISSTSNINISSGGFLALNGAPGAASAGGSINILPGAGNGANAGGDILARTGAGGATGNGGNIDFLTGAGGATSGNSGNIVVDCGAITLGTTGTITLAGTNASALTLGRSGLNVSVPGDLTITGNLTVNGTTTTVDTTNLLVEDALTIFASNAAIANEAGVAFERGSTGDDAIILWNEANARFELGLFDTAGGTTVPTGALPALSPLRLGDALIQVAANGETTSILHASAVIDFSVSNTASGLILAGVLVLGVNSRILTTVSGGGATGISTGDGVDADRWGTAGALTVGTTIGPSTYGDNTVQFNNSAGAANVVVSGVGGNPTVGTVRVTVTYMLLTAPTS